MAKFLQPTSDIPLNSFPNRNTGVFEGIKETDWFAGVKSGIAYNAINPSGNWINFQVRGENQYFPNFDTFNCTGFANNNSAEIQLKFKTGFEYNFSDRAMSVLAECQPDGNYVYKPAEVGRKIGRLLEVDYPNDLDNPQNWQQYNKTLPSDLLKKRLIFKEEYEWVGTDTSSLQYHLKQAPLLIIINAGSTTHNVVLVHIENGEYYYFDSYDPFLKKTTQRPSSALKLIVTPMNTIIFVHIKGTSEYGLLMVSPVGKMYVPASTEEDLKARGGVVIPLLPNGKIDYSKAREIELP